MLSTDIDAAEKLSEEAYSELSHCLVEEISTTDDVQFTEDCLKTFEAVLFKQ